MIGDPEYKIGRPRQLYNGAPRRDVVPLARRQPRVEAARAVPA
jgi:citrate synthase